REGARRGTRDHADGRALWRARSDHARRARRGVPAAPRAHGPHDADGDPRHARGPRPRGSHRRDAGGRGRCTGFSPGASRVRGRCRRRGAFRHAAPARGAPRAAPARRGRPGSGDDALSGQLEAAWRVLPEYLGEHVVLSAASLALGLAISAPLMVLALQSPRVRWAVLAFASVVQTIPSLALLALFYPVLLALSAATAKIAGVGFSALGFLPSLLALTLYSMLPILRNGVAGILNLDPSVIEAARAVGFTDRERLLRIELPLAAPMLMAGLRTAAVWVIGAATLSTPVGQTSLGNYIFAGLQIENWVFVLFGCAAAALLALTVDLLLGLIESGTAERKPARIAVGGAAVRAGAGAAPGPGLDAAGGPKYVVGAKTFSEQFVLAELIASRIAAQGAAAEQRVGLGSTIAFRALARGELDVY